MCPYHGHRWPDNGGVPIDDISGESSAEVARRLEAGASLEEVAHWLYLGPAAKSPITAIKALRAGSGLGLAECKDVIDAEVLADDPDYFARGVSALRTEFVDAMELPDDSGPPALPPST